MSQSLVDIDVDYIWLDCLWCDQGMAHVLRTYTDTQGKANSLSVFDFGAEQMFKSSVLRAEQAAPAVASLMNYLQNMETPRIEYFIVSHQDTDHWSLVKYFLDAVTAVAMPLTIGKLVYGGDEWGANALNQMRALGAYTANAARDVVRQTRTYSDFPTGGGATTQLGNLGPVTIQTLMVNAATPSHTTGAMRKNGTSAVTAIGFDGSYFILPGDATWETLVACNTLLTSWPQSPFLSTFMLSVPHHGALATMTHGTTEARGFQLINQFVNFAPAKNTVASAGSGNRYSHPHLTVLEAFSARVQRGGLIQDEQPFPHTFVAWSARTGDWAEQPPTTRNIYTTVLSHGGNPIYVADWSFAFSRNYQLTAFTRFAGAAKSTLGYEPMEEEEEQWWDNYEDDDLNQFLATARSVLPAHVLETMPEGAELFSYRLGDGPEVVRPLNPRVGQKKRRGVKRVKARARGAGQPAAKPGPGA